MIYACELVMRDGDMCNETATWVHTTTGPGSGGVPGKSYSCHWHANELGDFLEHNTGHTNSERIRPQGSTRMITISLPDDVARLVYDELQGRVEFLDVEGDMDERDPADIQVRVFRALETALLALDNAGSGPSPMGTYGQP